MGSIPGSSALHLHCSLLCPLHHFEMVTCAKWLKFNGCQEPEGDEILSFL